jgi:hypothetical protein
MSDQFTAAYITALSARLDKLTPDSKGQWGSMGVTQMLTHLNDAFKICLGMKPAKDKSNFVWNKLIFPIAIYGMGFFPRNSDAPVEINQQKEGSKPRDFYTELEFLKKMLDIFNEREGDKLKPHPLFGKLDKKQWRDLFVVHLDHHLKQFGV